MPEDRHTRIPPAHRAGGVALRATGGGVLSTLYTLHSTLYYCHAVRDDNITLRAAQ